MDGGALVAMLRARRFTQRLGGPGVSPFLFFLTVRNVLLDVGTLSHMPAVT